MERSRQSNFELLRLIAMLMIMLGHAMGYVDESNLAGTDGAIKLANNQLCLVSVNVFVMISGWFGIKASWKGALKLLFQVWFLALLCFGVFAALGFPVSFRKDLLPYLLFGYGYWFVVSYLILYALSPVLNSFAERAPKKQFTGVLIAFFGSELIYGFLLDIGHFDYGFSPLFFIGLYLLARYARLYPGKLLSFSKCTDLGIYLGVSVLSMFGFWLGYKWFGMGFHLNHYDSPFSVIAALYLLLFFSKLDFQSRFINWLAASAFAIYLIHENVLVSPHYHLFFNRLQETVPISVRYLLMLGVIIVLGLVFILIDKIRLLAWNRILFLTGSNKQ